MQKKSLGFERDHIVIIPYGTDVSKQYNVFRTELLRNTSFKEVARSSRIPTGRLLDDMGAYTMVGDSLRPLNTDIKFVSVDYDFIPAYGIKLLRKKFFA